MVENRLGTRQKKVEDKSNEITVLADLIKDNIYEEEAVSKDETAYFVFL